MSAPPPYTKSEIERRWLVPTAIELGEVAEREREIEDRYVEGTRLRIRKVTEPGCAPIYKLGKKYVPEATGSHHVVSIYLNEAEYAVLARLPAKIAKKRRLTVFGGALDVYEKPNPGLRIFEVEFANTEAAAVYVPPPGIGVEVTNDPHLTGYALSGRV